VIPVPHFIVSGGSVVRVSGFSVEREVENGAVFPWCSRKRSGRGGGRSVDDVPVDVDAVYASTCTDNILVLDAVVELLRSSRAPVYYVTTEPYLPPFVQPTYSTFIVYPSHIPVSVWKLVVSRTYQLSNVVVYVGDQNLQFSIEFCTKSISS